MELRPMARVIERWGGDPTILRAERILADNGVAIEYVHTPLQSGNNNVLGRNELTGDATRLALVWRDEMYGARIGNEWRHVAASYGVPYIHRELSIFVHLPDDFPVRDGAYRQRLVLVSTGEELECEDFMKEIHALRPQWVRDLVEKAIAPRQATSMAEVEKTLAERLRKARVKRVEQAYSGTLASLGDGNSEGGASVDEMTTPERHNRTVLDPEADADPAGHKAQQPRQPQRKVKAAQRISSAPRIIWLDQPDAVEAEEAHLSRSQVRSRYKRIVYERTPPFGSLKTFRTRATLLRPSGHGVGQTNDARLREGSDGAARGDVCSACLGQARRSRLDRRTHQSSIFP